MVSNIIKKELIEYTKQQCELNNIKLTPGVQTVFFGILVPNHGKIN